MTLYLVLTLVAIAFFFVLWPTGAKKLEIDPGWIAPLMLINTTISALMFSVGNMNIATLPSWRVIFIYFLFCIGNAWATVKYGYLVSNQSLPTGDVIVVQCVSCIAFAVLFNSVFITKTMPSLTKFGAYALCIIAVYAVVKTR